MPRIPPELCARCKGYKRLCGLPKCPILESFRAQMSAALRVEGREVEGATPPGVLVGESGYPKVSLYILIPPGVRGEEAKLYDDPITWSRSGLTLARIVRLRASTLGGKMRVDARDPYRLYETEVGLAVLSERPVDTDAILSRPPIPRLRFHGITKPLGPSAPVVKVRVESSPKLHPRLESAIWEDALAAVLVGELYRSGLDVYSIQRAFSMGFLGRARQRRLVPTRWSITAVDEILSRHLREAIRDKPSIDLVEVYFAEYLGNRFIIVLMPGEGSIEWIEVWHPNTVWTRGSKKPVIYYLYEDPLGRKTMEDGGYSAAKVSLLEALARRGRKADAVIIREILPSYYAPVGNWHIRETMRKALSSPPLAKGASTLEVKKTIESLLVAPPHLVFSKASLLGLGRRMTRLPEFLDIES